MKKQNLEQKNWTEKNLDIKSTDFPTVPCLQLRKLKLRIVHFTITYMKDQMIKLKINFRDNQVFASKRKCAKISTYYTHVMVQSPKYKEVHSRAVNLSYSNYQHIISVSRVLVMRLDIRNKRKFYKWSLAARSDGCSVKMKKNESLILIDQVSASYKSLYYFFLFLCTHKFPLTLNCLKIGFMLFSFTP